MAVSLWCYCSRRVGAWICLFDIMCFAGCNHILTHRFLMYICVITHNGLSTTKLILIILLLLLLDLGNYILVISHNRLCPLFQELCEYVIGDFRVLLCLCFKTSLSAKPLIWNACSFVFKVIFIRMVAHLNPLWDRGTSQGNAEMAYWLNLIKTIKVWLLISLMYIKFLKCLVYGAWNEGIN